MPEVGTQIHPDPCRLSFLLKLAIVKNVNLCCEKNILCHDVRLIANYMMGETVKREQLSYRSVKEKSFV